MKEMENAEKSLIPNVFFLCNLLTLSCIMLQNGQTYFQNLAVFTTLCMKGSIVNPATSGLQNCFSMRRLKTWLRSTMINRCFNSLGLVNV